MKLIRFRKTNEGPTRVGCLDGDAVVRLDLTGTAYSTLADVLDAEDPRRAVAALRSKSTKRFALADVQILPPIDRQEVWAAGVTYKRSKAARMEESKSAASCYDRVYESPRPELFFKATGHRTAGPGQPLRIRGDSAWNVPEPELAVVLNARLEIVGCTIGNDMSSRDIEGENPLYLPQAKVYDGCCGLGPCIALIDDIDNGLELKIEMSVDRAGKVVFEGETTTAQLARTPQELVSWLGRDHTFPNGVFLLTGTGIVPESDFTLAAGDVVTIAIEGIGTLSNPIDQVGS
jgi:2-dehydro-3-deoxy-D-arabinonate dehydratase